MQLKHRFIYKVMLVLIGVKYEEGFKYLFELKIRVLKVFLTKHEWQMKAKLGKCYTLCYIPVHELWCKNLICCALESIFQRLSAFKVLDYLVDVIILARSYEVGTNIFVPINIYHGSLQTQCRHSQKSLQLNIWMHSTDPNLL